MSGRTDTSSTTAEAGRGFGPFLSVWAPAFLVITGTGLCLFGLSWWISRAPDGGARLGVIVGVSSAVSLLTVVALSGTIDRADRRGTINRLLGVLALPAGALIWLFSQQATTITIVAAGTCYVSVQSVQSLYLAAMESVSADLALSSWPSARTAMLTQMPQQVGSVIAPTIAGSLVAQGALSSVPSITLVAVAITGALVWTFRQHFDGVTAQALPVTPATATHPVSVMFRDASTSIKLIRSHQDLSYLVIFGMLANLVVFPFYAVLAAFVSEYGLSQQDQALLYSRAATAYGLGLLLGTLVLLRYRRDSDPRLALAQATASFAVICVVLIAVTFVHGGPALIAAMLVNGVLFSVLIAVGGGVWLHRTPAEIRVRVFGLRRLTVFSSIPVGTMLMGAGGAAVGYRFFVRILVAATLVALAATWIAFRNRFNADAITSR